jgi:hypothetical protein
VSIPGATCPPLLSFPSNPLATALQFLLNNSALLLQQQNFREFISYQTFALLFSDQNSVQRQHFLTIIKFKNYHVQKCKIELSLQPILVQYRSIAGRYRTDKILFHHHFIVHRIRMKSQHWTMMIVHRQSLRHLPHCLSITVRFI